MFGRRKSSFSYVQTAGCSWWAFLALSVLLISIFFDCSFLLQRLFDRAYRLLPCLTYSMLLVAPSQVLPCSKVCRLLSLAPSDSLAFSADRTVATLQGPFGAYSIKRRFQSHAAVPLPTKQFACATVSVVGPVVPVCHPAHYANFVSACLPRCAEICTRLALLSLRTPWREGQTAGPTHPPVRL